MTPKECRERVVTTIIVFAVGIPLGLGLIWLLEWLGLPLLVAISITLPGQYMIINAIIDRVLRWI